MRTAGRLASRWRLVALAAATVHACAARTESGGHERHPPLPVVVSVLDEASPAERADFAYIALDEMRAAYEAEAGAALGAADALRIGGDEVRWARATQDYAARLGELASRIESTTDVRLFADPSGSVGLFLVDVPVLVSGPRIGQPGRLEARILDRYCAIQPCNWPAAEVPVEQVAPPPDTALTWAFQRRGRPVCRSDDGLSLWFEDLDRLDAKRRACASAVAELRALAREIGRHEERGARVDWSVLRVESLGAGRGEHVRVDRSGRYLLMRLPTLAMAPGILVQTRHWVEARSRGEIAPVEIRDAERVLGPVFEPTAP